MIKIKRFLSALAASLVLVIPGLSGVALAAPSATMYLTPASGSFNNGDSFTLTIYEDSGSEPVNALQANLSYSTAQLQYVSYGNTAAFDIDAQHTGGGGSVHMGRGASSSKTGLQAVATVTFKAIAGSGTAQVNFASGSAVVSANTNSDILGGLGNTSGGSYGLTSPPAPPPPSGGGSGGTTGSRAKSSSKKTVAQAPATPAAPPKDTTPPKISDTKVTNLSSNSAQINWTTDEATTSEVDYGLNTSYGLVAIMPGNATSHQVTLNSALIIPGLTYHFKIKTSDAAGNTTTSQDANFRSKGANLLVTVLNQKNNKPLSGATVSLSGTHGLTNDRGQTTLKDLPLGKQIASIEYGGKKTAGTVNIETINTNGAPQAVSFKVEVPKKFPWVWLTLLILVLLGIAWWVGTETGTGLRNFLRKFGGGSGSSSDASPSDQPEGHMMGDYTPPTEPTVIKPSDKPQF